MYGLVAYKACKQAYETYRQRQERNMDETTQPRPGSPRTLANLAGSLLQRVRGLRQHPGLGDTEC